MEEKVCCKCSNAFEATHGNQRFCSKDCLEKFRANKQRENNAICKEITKGFVKNYKLLLDILPVAGSTKITMSVLLKKGFDQDAFYGTFLHKENNQIWCKVNEYYFHLSSIDKQIILYIHKN